MLSSLCQLTRRALATRLIDQRGFTFIEVVVAVTVIVVGVFGAVALANTSANASDSNERRVVATNLAREGLELMRNLRDSNWAAYSAQQKIKASGGQPGQPRSVSQWDCAPASATSAASTPPTCDIASLVELVSADSDKYVDFMIAVAPTGNSVPYLVRKDIAETKDPAYLNCPLPADPNVPASANNPAIYQPSDGTGCLGKTYYRKLRVSLGKPQPAGASASHSLKIESSVSWGGRRAPAIAVEEYLTDWQKFDPVEPPPIPGSWSAQGRQFTFCTLAKDNQSDLCDADQPPGTIDLFTPSDEQTRGPDNYAELVYKTTQPPSDPVRLPVGNYRLTINYHAVRQTGPYNFPVIVSISGGADSFRRQFTLPVAQPNSRASQKLVLDNATLGNTALSMTSSGTFKFQLETHNGPPNFAVESLKLEQL